MPSAISLDLLPERLKDANSESLLAQGLALIQSIQSSVADGEPFVQLRRHEPGRSADRAAHGVPAAFDAYDAWVDEHKLGADRWWSFHHQSVVTEEEATDGVSFTVRRSVESAGDAFGFPSGYYVIDEPEFS